nr:hypothetical protein CFP56_64180 [Quercus suber]
MRFGPPVHEHNLRTQAARQSIESSMNLSNLAGESEYEFLENWWHARMEVVPAGRSSRVRAPNNFTLHHNITTSQHPDVKRQTSLLGDGYQWWMFQ